MKKWAFFDFCGTIVDYQSLNPFLEYVLKHESPKKYRIICNRTIKFILRLIERMLVKSGAQFYLYKFLMTRQMKGVTRSALNRYGTEYYQQIVKKHFICKTIELVDDLQENGYEIAIVSGGSDFYIKDFATEKHINHLITAEFEFADEKCTGKLLSECMNEEKKLRINTLIRQQETPCTCEIACSDSVTDMPMFELCKRRLVISHGSHQPWVTKDMEEIIWN